MRLAKASALVFLAFFSAGCATCDCTYDEYFPVYGGSRARLDMVNGRVASLFDPAASVGSAPAAREGDEPELQEQSPDSESEGSKDSQSADHEPDENEALLGDLDQFLSGPLETIEAGGT